MEDRFLFMVLKSEIDEGTKTSGVEGTEAEQEGGDGEDPDHQMLPSVVIGVIDLLL